MAIMYKSNFLNIFFGLVLTFLFCGCSKSDSGSSATSLTYYISPSGNDQNSGSISYPFATVQKAIDTARQTKTSNTGDINIVVGDGTYRLSSPIVLTSADSANDGYKLTIKAANGATPIFNGATKVLNWTLVDASKNIYSAKVSSSVSSRQFYVNGSKAIRAKTMTNPDGFLPQFKYSASGNTPMGILFVPVKKNDGSLDTSWINPATWTNISDIEAVSAMQWRMIRVPLKSVTQYNQYTVPTSLASIATLDGIFAWLDALILKIADSALYREITSYTALTQTVTYDLTKTGLLEMQEPAWTNANIFLGQNSQPAIWSFARVSFFENAYEFLDEKGEWYFNKNTQTIYYIPRDGEDMSNIDAEFPQLEYLIKAEGSEGSIIKNISFEGLTFRYATWLAPSGKYGYVSDQSGNYIANEDYSFNTIGHVQNTTATPGNISLKYAQNINFSGNIFEHLGAAALSFSTGSQSNTIKDNLFEDIASSAIWLGGVSSIDYNPTINSITKNNTIQNNLIRYTGQDYYDTPAINVGFSQNTLIDHNTISYSAWAGISMGWGWGLLDPGVNLGLNTATANMWGVYTRNTPNSNNKITNNRIYSFLNQLWDGGGIYTTGYQGTSSSDALLIQNNVISDRNSLIGGNTIYTDGMSRYVNVKENVLFKNTKGNVYFGTNIKSNDPFFYQFVQLNFMTDFKQIYLNLKPNADQSSLPYGSDQGGCRTYGDIIYDGNYRQYDYFYDPCTSTHAGALTNINNKNVYTNISAAQAIADGAGVYQRPANIPTARWILPSNIVSQ